MQSAINPAIIFLMRKGRTCEYSSSVVQFIADEQLCGRLSLSDEGVAKVEAHLREDGSIVIRDIALPIPEICSDASAPGGCHAHAHS